MRFPLCAGIHLRPLKPVDSEYIGIAYVEYSSLSCRLCFDGHDPTATRGLAILDDV